MDINQTIIDNINELIIKNHVNNVNSIYLGIIPNYNIKIFILHIIVHAFENKEIFNNDQLNNLNKLYNYVINNDG